MRVEIPLQRFRESAGDRTRLSIYSSADQQDNGLRGVVCGRYAVSIASMTSWVAAGRLRAISISSKSRTGVEGEDSITLFSPESAGVLRVSGSERPTNSSNPSARLTRMGIDTEPKLECVTG